MKVIGKINKRAINEEGNLELTIEIANLYQQEEVKALDKKQRI